MRTINLKVLNLSWYQLIYDWKLPPTNLILMSSLNTVITIIYLETNISTQQLYLCNSDTSMIRTESWECWKFVWRLNLPGRQKVERGVVAIVVWEKHLLADTVRRWPLPHLHQSRAGIWYLPGILNRYLPNTCEDEIIRFLTLKGGENDINGYYGLLNGHHKERI